MHPKGYAEDFARERDIPKVYKSLEEMVPEVDCAILHGCNWDAHIERARIFVRAGKSVLIDKPLAGRPSHLKQIVEWVNQGARITGGSSLRYCLETQEWLDRDVEERGKPSTVLCGCGVDEFNYGIHAYALLCGIMGAGAVSVQHLGTGVQRRVQIDWADGRKGFVIVGKADSWLPFHASIITEKTVTQYQVDSTRLYRNFLQAILPYLSGETPHPPVPITELIEPELWAIAARTSRNNGNRPVLLSDIADSDTGYDGSEFAESYRLARYPA